LIRNQLCRKPCKAALGRPDHFGPPAPLCARRSSSRSGTRPYTVAHFGEIRGEGTVTNELDGEALVWGLQSFAPRLKPLLAVQTAADT